MSRNGDIVTLNVEMEATSMEVCDPNLVFRFLPFFNSPRSGLSGTPSDTENQRLKKHLNEILDEKKILKYQNERFLYFFLLDLVKCRK